jgi:hypothetical protein
MKLGLSMAIIFAACSSSRSQEHEWHLMLANGEAFHRVALERLVDDSLVIRSEKTQTLPLNSLCLLRKEKEPRLGRGAVIGAVMGTTAGALIGVAMDNAKANCQPGQPDECFGSWSLKYTKHGAIIGGLTGLVIGGIIGAATGKDEIYDFSQITPKQKSALIKTLLAK